MKAHNPANIAAFPPELPPTRRYTLGGDASAEHQVQQDLSRISADVDAELRPGLVALVLVGRFARGEGGVVLRGGEPHGHPSYRFLAVVEQRQPEHQVIADRVATGWTDHLGVPVHIHCHTRNALKRSRKTLWWLDVARGNAEVLSGDRHALQSLRALDVGDLPSDEAGFLVTQAAAELAIARIRESGEATALDGYLHRAALACGDAALLLAGRFGATLQSRETQLAGLGEVTERVSAYHAATVYLGRPDDAPQPSDAALRGRLARVGRWHLEVEHARRTAPTTPSAFARHRERLFDRLPVRPTRPRTWLRRLQGVTTEFPYVGDDRERLARAAVALAYAHEDRGCRLMATRLLRIPHHAASDGMLADTLEQLLRRVRARAHQDAVDASFYA